MKMVICFTTIITLVFSSLLFAAPAYQGSIVFKQKDGSSFKGKLKGDEWFNWVEDKQGNIIKYNKKSKNYEYGVIKQKNGEFDLLPSGVMAGTQAKMTSSGNIQADQVMVEKIDQKTLSKIWKQKRSKVKRHPKK